jgi:hypothetical protein
MARRLQDLTRQVAALKLQSNSNPNVVAEAARESAVGGGEVAEVAEASLSLEPGKAVMESSDCVVVRGTEHDAKLLKTVKASHSALIVSRSIMHIEVTISTVTAPHRISQHLTASHSILTSSHLRNAPSKPARHESNFAAL